MPSRPEQLDYQSYLLRLWREAPGAPWRVSLHSTLTDQEIIFACIDEMVAYLKRQGPIRPDNPTRR